MSASVPRRKQACKSCRQRKRRCDAKRPVCGLCRKWGISCEYGAITSNNSNRVEKNVVDCPPWPLQNQAHAVFDHAVVPTPGRPLNDELFNLHLPSADMSHPIPDWGLDSLPGGDDLLMPAALPPTETLSELVDIFFSRLYHRFPCFHKARLYAEIQRGQLQIDSPLLCYAICAVAARFHPDPTIKNRQTKWYDEAKFLYEFSSRDLPHAVRTIQAVLCLVFHSFTTGDFSSCWLFLGKAWRQITANGMNRVDSLVRKDVYTGEDSTCEQTHELRNRAWHETSAISREECRRTLWLLFMQDRAQSWPTGWAPAIPESHFKVSLPMPESTFQSLSDCTPISATHNVPFDKDFGTLLASTSSSKEPSNILFHLVTAYILLGRTAEHIHSPHEDSTSPAYRMQCSILENYLVKFRLSLPCTATSIPDASPSDQPLVVWLNIIINTVAILLHSRLASLPKPTSIGDTTETITTSPDPYTLALAAAKSSAHIIRTTSQVSTSLLLNPSIASALYVAVCILIIHMRLTDDASCATDIELFKLVFARMGEVYAVIGTKFQVAMERDLGRNKQALAKVKEDGLKGLWADCSGWVVVEKELRRRGLIIT